MFKIPSKNEYEKSKILHTQYSDLALFYMDDITMLEEIGNWTFGCVSKVLHKNEIKVMKRKQRECNAKDIQRS